MRLTRTGTKKRPSYRVIVADSRAPRDGRHVDILGHYDPLTNPATVQIDVERAVQWLRNGAQPTERVRILLRHSGVLKAHDEALMADKRARKEAAASAPAKAVRRATRAVSSVVTAAAQVADTVADAAQDAAGTVADAAGAVIDAVTPKRARAREK